MPKSTDTRRMIMNAKLVEILAEIFMLDEDDVKSELTPEEVASWSSLNHLRLITVVEEEFGIKLSMDEIQSIDNVARLNELVEAHLGSRIK
jgi:acyl carrier protein